MEASATFDIISAALAAHKKRYGYTTKKVGTAKAPTGPAETHDDQIPGYGAFKGGTNAWVTFRIPTVYSARGPFGGRPYAILHPTILYPKYGVPVELPDVSEAGVAGVLAATFADRPDLSTIEQALRSALPADTAAWMRDHQGAVAVRLLGPVLHAIMLRGEAQAAAVKAGTLPASAAIDRMRILDQVKKTRGAASEDPTAVIAAVRDAVGLSKHLDERRGVGRAYEVLDRTVTRMRDAGAAVLPNLYVILAHQQLPLAKAERVLAFAFRLINEVPNGAINRAHLLAADAELATEAAPYHETLRERATASGLAYVEREATKLITARHPFDGSGEDLSMTPLSISDVDGLTRTARAAWRTPEFGTLRGNTKLTLFAWRVGHETWITAVTGDRQNDGTLLRVRGRSRDNFIFGAWRGKYATVAQGIEAVLSGRIDNAIVKPHLLEDSLRTVREALAFAEVARTGVVDTRAASFSKVDALTLLGAFASTDETRYGLNGVFVGDPRGRVGSVPGTWLVASDGHRLAALRTLSGLHGPNDAGVPQRLAGLGGPVALAQKMGALHRTYISVVETGEPPDWWGVVSGGRYTGVLDVEAIREAAEKVVKLFRTHKAAADLGGRSPLIFTIDDGDLRVTGFATEHADMDDTMIVRLERTGRSFRRLAWGSGKGSGPVAERTTLYEGEIGNAPRGHMAIGLNAQFVLEAFTALKRLGYSKVTWTFGHALGPSVFTPAGSMPGDAIFVVMPVRLD